MLPDEYPNGTNLGERSKASEETARRLEQEEIKARRVDFELEPLDSELVQRAADHLGAALIQALPSDDQMIMDHVRDARQLLLAALEGGR